MQNVSGSEKGYYESWWGLITLPGGKKFPPRAAFHQHIRRVQTLRLQPIAPVQERFSPQMLQRGERSDISPKRWDTWKSLKIFLCNLLRESLAEKQECPVDYLFFFFFLNILYMQVLYRDKMKTCSQDLTTSK